MRVGEVVNSQTSLYIQLFGENGETSKIMLRPAGPSLSKFEPGRTYKFTVETVDIGKVQYDSGLPIYLSLISATTAGAARHQN